MGNRCINEPQYETYYMMNETYCMMNETYCSCGKIPDDSTDMGVIGVKGVAGVMGFSGNGDIPL
jgi:hypothetical protein